MILTYKYLAQRLKTENGTLMKLVTTIQHDFSPINSTVTKKLLTSQEFGRNCTEEGQKLLLMYLLTKRTEQIICLVLSSCIWKSWVWHNFTNITTPNFRVEVSCMYVFFWSTSLQTDSITLFLGFANYSQKNCKTKTVHKKTVYYGLGLKWQRCFKICSSSQPNLSYTIKWTVKSNDQQDSTSYDQQVS